MAGTTLTPPGTLKEYSQWLSDFQAANFDQDLELPGQYTGLSKPLPEYHVKINSFDDRVSIKQGTHCTGKMAKKCSLSGKAQEIKKKLPKHREFCLLKM